jgi:hypothetical protein
MEFQKMMIPTQFSPNTRIKESKQDVAISTLTNSHSLYDEESVIKKSVTIIYLYNRLNRTR